MKSIRGSIVALVTPMHEDGSVDFDALRKLMKSGDVEKLYNKWFMSPIPPSNTSLNLPMSDALNDLLGVADYDGLADLDAPWRFVSGGWCDEADE